MNEQQVAELIRKYNDNTIQAAEKTALDIWYLKYALDSENELSKVNEDLMIGKLKTELPLRYKENKLKLWPRIVAVAAVLAIVATIIFWSVDNNADQQIYHTDVVPGKTGATLTLANGKKIEINNALEGNIANESGVTISKTKDGLLVYEITGEENGVAGYNTLSTGSGEQTQVRLPDATVVFLNAESSLKYPTHFSQTKKRIVSLNGEGYFQVTKDKEHPFVVEANNQAVEVLGTTFNISNYADESATKTTLLEGSVRLTNLKSKNTIVLNPGEQGIVNDSNLEVKPVEVDDVIAWKNGYFMFNNETLESIMKKVSRWYKVDVLFQDEMVKRKTFFGTISRYGSISELLKLLQKTEGAKFDIEGKKITVSKKN